MAKEKYGVPAILSFFIAGLGQLIKGELAKGIGIMITQFVLGFFAGLTMYTVIGPIILGILIVIVWLWNIWDAYNKQVD